MTRQHPARPVGPSSSFAPLVAAIGALALAHALSGDACAETADIARGKALYAKACVSCHGDRAQGKRELNSPALHTQEPWYLLSQLQKFKSGLRGANPKDLAGAIMSPVARSLPDEQSMIDLAAYISAIDGPPPVNEVKGDPAAGAVTYKKLCATCHGDGGRGKPDVKSPALVGQNDWYVAAQLVKFRQGLRGADPKDVQGAQMRAMSMTLVSDKAVNDVAAYIATLK